eukprot:6268783-Alexandrium_andersonii.AAC.1
MPEHHVATQRQHPWLPGDQWPRLGGSRRLRAKLKGQHRNLANRSHYGNSWPGRTGTTEQGVRRQKAALAQTRSHTCISWPCAHQFDMFIHQEHQDSGERTAMD